MGLDSHGQIAIKCTGYSNPEASIQDKIQFASAVRGVLGDNEVKRMRVSHMREDERLISTNEQEMAVGCLPYIHQPALSSLGRPTRHPMGSFRGA